MDEDDEERNFCYIEGSLVDRNTAEEVSELHENVWYKMKPPKKSSTLYSPSVTARQIDLVRSILMGKHALKIVDPKQEMEAEKHDFDAEMAKVIKLPTEIKELSLVHKKSSVRFLAENIYK